MIVAKTIMAVLFSVFILTAIIAFQKWRELSKECKLRKLVAWSVIGGDRFPLWSEIANAQCRLNLPNKYCIAGDDEWSYVKEIIAEYKDDLMYSYFKESLHLIESKYVIHGESYFMLTLYAFLAEHQCDYKFCGHDMHKERISYKQYGESFSAGYDATYSITDFAMLYHKMYYITHMYCKNSKITNPDGLPNWRDRTEKNLKDILDSKQIKKSRC